MSTKWKNIIYYVVGALIGAATILLVSNMSYKLGHWEGRSKGHEEMFFAVTDTVTKVLEKQIKSDTSITKFVIVNPDTNTFILSRKTALK